MAQPSPILAQLNLAKNLLCNADNSGAIQVTVTGGQGPYKYSWSSGQTTEDLTGVAAGDYTLTVTDALNCNQTLKATLTQPDVFAAKVADVKSILCKSDKKGEVHIDVTGGVAPYRYSWSNGDKAKDIVGVQAGSYSVRITDANGCIQNVNATITEPAALVATLGAVNNNNCFGETKGSVQVAVSGGTQPYVYAWTSGESTKDINNLAVGEYSLNVTDANGCAQSVKATITGPVVLESKVREVVNVKCFGDKTGAVSVDVAGGTQPYSYSWSNGDSKQNLSAVVAGDYQLSIKDAKGCVSTLTSKITQPAQLTTAIDTVHNVKCFGDNKGLVDVSVAGGIKPYAYLWSNGNKI